MGGFIGKILKVNLTTGKVKEESLKESFYRTWLGTYGLGARIIYDEITPKTDPLSPGNILGFTTGVLTGTVPGSAVTIVVGKSPLTGTWGETSAKGFFAPELRFAGYDDIFFYGRSEKPVYLRVTDRKAEIRDATDLWGRETYEVADMIREENGDERIQYMCIGPAGEKLSKMAAIITGGGHAAGRQGMGAVMGSKNLKAVAVRGTGKIPVADIDEAIALKRELRRELRKTTLWPEHNKYGNCAETEPLALLGDSPCKNWAGVVEINFPTVGEIGGDEVIKYKTKSTTCYGCFITCKGVLEVKTGPYAVTKNVFKTEYETAAAFGTNCLNGNVESIIYLNNLCDRYGLDTISTGSTLAFAMECYEKGLITKEDTDGIELTWGNADAMVEMTEKIAEREGFGDVLADGVKVAAKRIGRGSEKFAIHVGGQELPMHHPLHYPGLGTTYASDATPGRHSAPAEWDMEAYGGYEAGIIPVIPGIEFPVIKDKYDPHSRERAMIHAYVVKWGHALHASGLCWVMEWFGAKDVPWCHNFLKAVMGWDMTVQDLLTCGERIACIRQAFNLREGFRPSDFKLPDRVAGKPPFKAGPHKGKTVDAEIMTKEYFKCMDWDYETGRPSKRRLIELGLEDVAKDLYP